MTINRLEDEPINVALNIARKQGHTIGGLLGYCTEELISPSPFGQCFTLLEKVDMEKKPSFFQKLWGAITLKQDTYPQKLEVWHNNCARGKGFVFEVYGGDKEIKEAETIAAELQIVCPNEKIRIIQQSFSHKGGFQLDY